MSTLRTISNFKSALKGGGARPNLFEVSLSTFPAAAIAAAGVAGGSDWDSDNKTNFSFMCKAANMPASNIASIDVPFRGRIFKVAGDRTIDNWSVTILNDENFKIRNAFEAWMNAIGKLDNASGATNPASYMSNATVMQMGRGYSSGKESTANSQSDGLTSATPLKTYTFEDIFPVSVSAIDLSYDSSDTIEEFTVDFAVQSWYAGTKDGEGVADATGANLV
tara:strand:- start:810 stop:1475 length:666 start_codon:yes stop_codon:yes gene_type:complete